MECIVKVLQAVVAEKDAEIERLKLNIHAVFKELEKYSDCFSLDIYLSDLEKIKRKYLINPSLVCAKCGKTLIVRQEIDHVNIEGKDYCGGCAADA